MTARTFLAAVLLSLLVGLAGSLGGMAVRDAVFDRPTTELSDR